MSREKFDFIVVGAGSAGCALAAGIAERAKFHVLLLEAELDRSAHKQMGVDNEEFIAGISCVAVPVRDGRGVVVAALAVHAPTARSPLSRSLELVPRLQQAASELAATF